MIEKRKEFFSWNESWRLTLIRVITSLSAGIFFLTGIYLFVRNELFAAVGSLGFCVVCFLYVIWENKRSFKIFLDMQECRVVYKKQTIKKLDLREVKRRLILWKEWRGSWLRVFVVLDDGNCFFPENIENIKDTHDKTYVAFEINRRRLKILKKFLNCDFVEVGRKF